MKSLGSFELTCSDVVFGDPGSDLSDVELLHADLRVFGGFKVGFWTLAAASPDPGGPLGFCATHEAWLSDREPIIFDPPIEGVTCAMNDTFGMFDKAHFRDATVFPAAAQNPSYVNEPLGAYYSMVIDALHGAIIAPVPYGFCAVWTDSIALRFGRRYDEEGVIGAVKLYLFRKMLE